MTTDLNAKGDALAQGFTRLQERRILLILDRCSHGVQTQNRSAENEEACNHPVFHLGLNKPASKASGDW